jgi:hypothetical protein
MAWQRIPKWNSLPLVNELLDRAQVQAVPLASFHPQRMNEIDAINEIKAR